MIASEFGGFPEIFFLKKKLVNLSIIAGLQRASNHHPEDLPGLFHDQEGEHFPVRRLHAVHEKNTGKPCCSISCV